MILKRSAIIMLALGVALAAALAAPTLARAYCVYNHTNTGLYVCGENCLRCLQTNVPAGGKACCPGDDKGCRGQTYITFSVDYGNRTSCNSFYVPKEVDAHGWVSLFGSCRKDWKKCDQSDACAGVTAKVYGKKGNVTYEGGVRQYAGDDCKQ